MVLTILLAAGVVMVVSLIGVVTTHRFAREFLEARLATLVSFSAGVFLVTAGALALEVFHVIDTWWVGVGLIVAGYLGAWALHALLPETHHHHDSACGHRHNGARKLIVGDAIHNVADGIILVPAWLASPALGLAVTVSIVIHEVLQEISEYFVLRQAGYSARQALGINFAISSTILLGVGLSYFALTTTALEGVLLALSSGFFLHVVMHDLLPKKHQHPDAIRLAEQVGVVALGVVLMASINFALGDAHVHGDDHQHEHEHVHEEAVHTHEHEDHVHHDEGDHDHAHEETGHIEADHEHNHADEAVTGTELLLLQ